MPIATTTAVSARILAWNFRNLRCVPLKYTGSSSSIGGYGLSSTARVHSVVRTMADPTEREPPKKKAKAKASSASSDVFTTHTPGFVPYDEAMRKPDDAVGGKKVISWNVAGLRAFVKKATDDLKLLYETEKFDVLAIQEHKLQESHVDDLQKTLEEDVFGGAGFHYHWNCSTEKKGYSGVAVVSKTKPLSVEYGIDGLPAAEAEGRVITAEFEDYFLVNVYVPNSGQGLVRLDYRVGEWDAKFSKYVKGLEAKKPVVLTGDMVRISCCLLLSTAVYCYDWPPCARPSRAPTRYDSLTRASRVRSFVLQNCAAEAIDIHSPKTNLKSAGFTPEERASFASCYLENGLVDSFRAMYPSAVGFTYWGYRGGLRAKNKGWRLDYFLLSRELFDSKAFDTYHLTGYNGSDHCPLGLTLKSLKSLQ